MKKLLALVVLTIFMATPMASAQSGGGSYSPSMESMLSEVKNLGSLSVKVSSKHVDFSWSGIEIGSNMSSWLRKTLDDSFGDGDGNVSVDEMEAGEELLAVFVQQEFKKIIHQEGSTGYFLIDKTNPSGATVTALDTAGLVGPVASDRTVTIDFDLSIEFPTKNQDVHTVKLDMGKYYFKGVNQTKAQEVAGDFSLVVVGGSGWSIDGASVQPDCAADNWDESSSSLRFDASDLDCFVGHSGLLLAFTIHGSEKDWFPVPGPELPLIVLGLLGLAFAMRRRL
jgi:hypothetical protein